MKLLLVEDDQNFAEGLGDALDTEGIQFVHVTNRADAIAAIEDAEFFDLAVLDLRIPSGAESLDADVEHGLAAYADCLERAAGTPIAVFSAYGSVDVMNELLRTANRDDPFGLGAGQQMTRFFKKSELPEALAFVRQTNALVADLESIEISFGPHQFEIGAAHRRALRVLAARLHGRVIKVEKAAGGLSSSRTLRCQIEDANGAVVARSIVKLDRLDALLSERDRYGRLAAIRLDARVLAPLGEMVQVGAGAQGLLSYSIADKTVSLAEEIARPDAVEVLRRLRDGLAPLREGAPSKAVTVRDIRLLFVNDRNLEQAGIEISKDLEDTRLQARWATHHGDLHGANVLIDEGRRPIIIDFARAAPGPPSVDPITLSLSTVFHPATREVRDTWPTVEAMASWDDVDVYVADCPFGDFIRACRTWTYDVTAGDLEVYAVAYAYALRQMTFPDVERELAEILVGCCIRRLRTAA